jgi:hypothetical protein
MIDEKSENNNQLFSVKVPIKKIIKKEFYSKLNDRIIFVNKLIYQFNIKFISEIINLNECKIKNKSEMYQKFQGFISINDRTKLHQSLIYSCNDLFESYRKNIIYNFEKNLKHYINCTTDLKGLELKNYKLNVIKSNIKLPNILPENLIKNNLNYDLKTDPFKYYTYLINMNKELKTRNKKLIRIFPQKSNCLISNITIDSDSLSQIFTDEIKNLIKEEKKLISSRLSKEEKKSKRKEITVNYRKNKEKLWNNFFYLDKIKKFCKNKKFHYLIKTDGTSCSLIFERNQNIQEYKPRYFTHCKDLNNKNKVVIDPGYNNILYCLDEKNIKFKYTKEHRFNALQTKKINKINNKILNSENCENKKELDYKYPEFKLNKNYSVINKLKQRSYINKQRHEQKIINKLKSLYKDSIFIIGDKCEYIENLKNTKSTPRIGLKKLLSKFFDLYYIDEYNTSKLYYKTGEVLNKTNDFSLLSFTNCNGSKGKINRDFNAVKNMMNIVQTFALKNEYISKFIPRNEFKVNFHFKNSIVE